MSKSSTLPEGFSYLHDVDPSILVCLRYANIENFTGSVVPGYLSSKAILTTAACEALKKVQAIVNKDGYSLVVYDGYRPQKAVDYFMRWSQEENLPTAQAAKAASYYPTLDRLRLFDLGYIASKSGHSRGSTVDLTLIELGKDVNPLPTCTARHIEGEEKEEGGGDGDGTSLSSYPFLDDNTVDMGASFDLFSPLSHYPTPLLQHLPHVSQSRAYLHRVMGEGGFRGYDQEWWHYTLCDEPYPQTYFDFDIC
ncbi:peptidase M15 [archaeon]|nr:MAG: peptidase M15 [archaeon]